MKKKVLFISIVLVLLGIVSFVVSKSITEVFYTKEEMQTVTTKKKNDAEIVYVNKDAKLSDITKEDGVVNVYIFWGNGCPHCKAEWEMIEGLRKKHAGEFAVYGFEIWYDHNNMEIMNQFAEAVGAGEVSSVPFIIVGNKYHEGSQSEDAFLSMVKNGKNSSFDVYFDKIK